MIEPGSPTGTLTISNSLTLQPGSSTVININASTGANGQINGLSSVTLGGTLIVTNLSGTLAAGNSFNVFNARSYSGAFSRISPALPGAGLAWDTGAGHGRPPNHLNFQRAHHRAFDWPATFPVVAVEQHGLAVASADQFFRRWHYNQLGRGARIHLDQSDELHH